MPVLKGSFQTVYALFINRLYEQRDNYIMNKHLLISFFLDLDLSWLWHYSFTDNTYIDNYVSKYIIYVLFRPRYVYLHWL